MQIILADSAFRNQCLPFTESRAVSDLRLGILTIRERWQHIAGKEVFVATVPWLRCLYPAMPSGNAIWIDALFFIYQVSWLNSKIKNFHM